MTSVTLHSTRRPLFPTFLDHLLRAEPALRRKRRQIAWLVAALFVLLAVVDARLWRERSLAPGYAIPVVLGAYAFGVRTGAALSVVAVVLRTLCAGRTYGPWWVYAGSALTLAEYLMLALGVGLLGRAVRRVERHGNVLGGLIDDARELTSTLAPEAVLRRGVEASVRLTGADGGFVASPRGGAWHAAAVYARDGWTSGGFVWWAHPAGPWETGDRVVAANGQGARVPPALGARVQLAVPVPGPDRRPTHALVVYRAAPRVFAEPTREVLELLALHVASALNAASQYGAAVRANEEKARMLAAVAHDLRNPLHALLWDTDTLLTRDGAEARELARMNDNAILALDLVRTLQEFAEVEAGQLGVDAAPVVLESLVEDLRGLMEPLLAGRPIEFRTEIAPGAGALVSDRTLLHRVLGNLLANAAKFTERGTIALSAVRRGEELAVAVTDTGPGVPPGEIERIFTPFVRGSARPVGAPRGMGLGLSIAVELSRLLGGRLEVESPAGCGSTFRVVLPLAGAAAPPVVPAAGGPLGPRGSAVVLLEDRLEPLR